MNNVIFGALYIQYEFTQTHYKEGAEEDLHYKLPAVHILKK